LCHVESWQEFHEWEAMTRKHSCDRFDPTEHTHGR
jgi:hypothetical protein